MKALRPGLLFVALLALASCEKEIGPAIDFTVPPIDSVVDSTAPPPPDTTYLANPETATPRMMLLEEFTGVKCPSCPAGHTTIKALATNNPGRIAVIGYQIFNFAQAFPIAGETRNDNRTQDATDIGVQIMGGIGQMPVAAFDRTLPAGGGALAVDRSTWIVRTNARLQVASPANLKITTQYDSATREVVALVRVAYTQALSGKQRLSLAITEDGIVDAQEHANGVYHEYDHEHVFRDMVTNIGGEAVLDSLAEKAAGRVYERRFRFTLDSKWNARRCNLIAFLHSGDAQNKEVHQTVEKRIQE